MRTFPAVRWSLTAIALALAACADTNTPTDVTPAPSASVQDAAQPIPGRYIVVFSNGVSNVARLANEIAAAHQGNVGHVYTAALKGFSVQLAAAQAEQAVASIRNNPNVRYVEQDQMVAISAEQTGATWGIDRIDQRNLPLSGTYVYNRTGAGVNAYILDTGIKVAHSDFGGRAFHGVNKRTDKPESDSDDCHGHGTHVAGTVGGTTWGVAKDVKLYAVRVLDCSGSGSNSEVIAGIDWVTANAVKPAVANMSLGGGFSQATNDAVKNSVNSGVVYAVAAGNGYGDACDGSPASEATALTVGATDQTDREASFSDRGSCLDIWAPGVNITSADAFNLNGSTVMSGTSMASPHVAGASVLYLEENPTATPAQVDNALKSNATTGKITWNNPFGIKPPPPPPGQDYLLYTGFIGGAPPPPPPAPAAPTSLTATAVSSSQIDLAWVDNADNESNYEVERCTGAGCTSFALIATLAANTTSYQNTGLASSTSYTYRVRATNSGGPSGYSNEASATTPAPPPNAAPVARYTWSCGTAKKNDRNCNYDGRTSSDDVGVTAYEWDFGDGNTGTGATISHRFPSRSTFAVTLTVRDAGGLSHSRTCNVTYGTSGTCQ